MAGGLKKAATSSRFTGKSEQILSIPAPAKMRYSRIVLLGVGEAAKADEISLQRAGGSAYMAAVSGKEDKASLVLEAPKGLKFPESEALANIVLGFALRSYRFDKYRTNLKAEHKPSLKSLALVGEPSAIRKAWNAKAKIVEGVFAARDLISEPANIIYPETMAVEALKLKELGVEVKVLNEKDMAKLGMGALLGVALGSQKPPRLVTMVWHGNPSAKDKRPVAFVGKGVTFDTGGISLKPGAGMWDMKYDMSGAAAVLGAMKSLALRKAKANIVGVIGLVENMPDGAAQRPGDIVTSMSGQTIEVLNTDAEGRLVLADAIWYAEEKFNPSTVIDLATLTGAIKIALGTEYAGLFANNDSLAERLSKAGEAVDESLWRLPLNKAFDKAIDSGVADMKNIADGSTGAGSATAAHFIERFIKKGVAWAHLDIASKAWAYRDMSVVPKGAVGFGVRLLDRFVADYIEAR
jgi:leucyl aminopeptidase